jgi:hypothetical protein
MALLLGVVVGAVVVFGLVLGVRRLADVLRESRTTRFAFEDRDTYLFLRLDRPLESGARGLTTMRALREALRLKLMGVGYQRVLVDVSGVEIANNRAFWLLIGALAPMLGNDRVQWAVVCRRRASPERYFRDSGVLVPFLSVREAEQHLHGTEARARVLLDAEQLDSLLALGNSRAA